MARAVTAAGVWYFGVPTLLSFHANIWIGTEREIPSHSQYPKSHPTNVHIHELSPENESERDDNYKVFLLLGIGGQRRKKCLQILYACIRCYTMCIGRGTMRMSPNPLKNIWTRSHTRRVVVKRCYSCCFCCCFCTRFSVFPCQDKYRLPREREVKCSRVSVNVFAAAEDSRFIWIFSVSSATVLFLVCSRVVVPGVFLRDSDILMCI